LGVYLQDMTADLAESFDLDKNKGILVTQVMEDSPAEDAGLKQGDVILQIDGDKVENVAHLRNRVALTAPGTMVRLLIFRDGERKTVKVKIGRLDSAEAGSTGREDDIPELGLSLQKLTPEIAERFGYENDQGVLIASVEDGSIADRAGIQRGSLILEINRQNVATVAEAKKLLNPEKGKTFLLLIKQGQGTRYVALKSE